MKFILLLAVIALFTFISTDGSPLPKKEKNNDNHENSHEDPTDKIETKKDKFKPSKEKNEQTIPDSLEEEDDQVYFMVPAGKHLQKMNPLNYKRIPKMPLKPRYVLKKQNYPTLPYTYPMFQHHEELMEPETGMEYIPNMMGKMSEDLPMYYIPMSRKGQFKNVDEVKQMYKSPFIIQDKELTPWNPYLENSDYYN